MKITYNYATHKNEVWYSEEEYEALKTKYENVKKEKGNKNNERKGNNLLK